jgi:hypothetical protein
MSAGDRKKTYTVTERRRWMSLVGVQIKHREREREREKKGKIQYRTSLED